ncbi:diphosphomevalonate decarboxylase [Anaeramoeba flamelloides]|uniref:Diphosphomevalonate decarboxylase n=1 Tax=Anaeramoeba flamelloides TaxID=1746091 RepID=A0ABQ8Z321_9EUKA|nr:diphosphomevalonate decarboxylase [Anaeramoeba flamelloides]
MEKEITCVAPPNIALIKYWGKKDENLIIPLNNSFSITLDSSDLFTKTTVRFCDPKKNEEDKFTLNEKPQKLASHKRIVNLIAKIREKSSLPNKDDPIEIDSMNSFPTAAGLASSSSGIAALTYCLGNLFEVYGTEPLQLDQVEIGKSTKKQEGKNEENKQVADLLRREKLSAISRQGSGSSCRSMFGGFVEWIAGEKNDGSDSRAKQIFPKSVWPELRVLVCVVRSEQKKVSSTLGMRRSVETSEYIDKFSTKVVPKNIKQIKQAIQSQDFETFANVTMKNSNAFHSVCLDTFPPIFYLNQDSKKVIDFVHSWNDIFGTQVGYTFDAGPNPVLIMLNKNLPSFLDAFVQTFQIENLVNQPLQQILKDSQFNKLVQKFPIDKQNICLERIIPTKIGDGVKQL